MEFINFGVVKAKYSSRPFTFALRFVYVSLNEYRALPSISRQRRKISIFWCLKLLCLDEIKFLGNVLVRLKENCPGFQQTPLDIMSGVSLHIFCPNSKVLLLPQLSLIIVGAPVTVISFLKVGYGDNYNTKMRPLAVNVTEIHCQTIFLLTTGALAPPDCGAPTIQHPQPF